MAFIKKDAGEIEINPFEAIGRDWGILTGKNSEGFNSMTVSWGGLGVLWNKNVVFAFVRPARYTKQFLDSGEYFSLSIMNREIHDKMKVFGSASGRDTDKYALSGFSAAEEDGVPYVEEAERVFICRTLSAGEIDPSWFRDKDIDSRNYPGKDYHTMYIGEIISVLEKK